MEPASYRLQSYTGANPFREGQAKTYGDDKLVNEFCPTSDYFSLFNEQHEILLGSRGSGKTTLLRMLSFSCLSRMEKGSLPLSAQSGKFIGFYVPLHLEFMSSLPQDRGSGSLSLEYFQFAFNCVAVKSFLAELKAIIAFHWHTAVERLDREAKVLEILANFWRDLVGHPYSCIEAVSEAVDVHYFSEKPWADGGKSGSPLFAKGVFAPIKAVLPAISRCLELNVQDVHWLACVDEAEFLRPEYLRCFNSFMRSEKRPIVLKLATLPYKYSVTETTVSGEYVEGRGNDFNFRSIDLRWDSSDFKNLTDNLLKQRLSRVGAFEPQDLPQSLETFLGKVGDDEPKDYFKLEMGEKASSDEAIMSGILRELSEERRNHFHEIKNLPERVASDFKKFSPVYYMRVMKRVASKGHRIPGFFAGPSIVRRVADGNPRRFIQLMNDLFDDAKERHLTTKRQHRVVLEFAEREFERAAGLPEFGLMLDGILTAVGDMMERRVHSEKEMVDCGYNFSVQKALLTNSVIRGALELGVAYRFLFVEQESLFYGISERSDFRLAHVAAAKYWLPMRKGGGITLTSRFARDVGRNKLLTRNPTTVKDRETALGSLQLEFQLAETVKSHDVRNEDV